MEPIRLDRVPDASRRQGTLFARCAGTQFDFVPAASMGNTDVSEIVLYDDIGYWGVTAKDFKEMLSAAGTGDILLKLNSPGGDVFDGLAIYNDLLAHPGRVAVHVTGLAASAASVIAMAADELLIADTAFLMIHNSWTIAAGNRHDLRDVAAILEKVDGALAKTYALRSGRGIRTIKEYLDAETWFTAEAAVDIGLADGTIDLSDGDGETPTAAFDLSVYAAVPDGLRAAATADWAGPKTVRDAERMLMRDAGYSRSQARAALATARQTPKDDKPGAGDVRETAKALADLAARITETR